MGERALLTGRAAARAREVVAEVGATMRKRGPKEPPALGEGLAGHAIVHAALEQALPGKGHLKLAERALTDAIGALAEVPTDPSLWSGFTGVAWVAELLGATDADEADEDAVDAALAGYVGQKPFRDTYDLIGGLAGFAVYALERLPRASAKRLLASVVDRLAENASRCKPGTSWRSDPTWVPEAFRATSDWDWNLGVAHGVPGLVAVLARICASEADAGTKRKARRLLDGAVTWLLAQELPKKGKGPRTTCFATAVGGASEGRPARSAWCYGDPGIAAALLVAAQCTGEREWKREAKRVALAAASRPEADCGVDEAGLCHGAAGLGHIYHRLYRGLGDERLADAARAWFGRAIAMRDPKARYVWNAKGPVIGKDGQVSLEWVSTRGFLTGSGGVVLALLAATGDADAAWDRALAVSAREVE